MRPAPLLRRLLAGRLPARARGAPDALRIARALVDGGCRVALEQAPGEDPAAALLELVSLVDGAGLAPAVELTLLVDRLGIDDARRVGSVASDAGVAVVVAGPAELVDAVGHPGAGVVVPAGEPGAEARCRALAAGHVRLISGPRRSAGADLAFVRCLNVLMAAEGRPGIAASDARIIAIAGERAAWNGRTPDSWELVMPYGVLLDEQRRLVAAGNVVRVAVTVTPGGRS